MHNGLALDAAFASQLQDARSQAAQKHAVVRGNNRRLPQASRDRTRAKRKFCHDRGSGAGDRNFGVRCSHASEQAQGDQKH